MTAKKGKIFERRIDLEKFKCDTCGVKMEEEFFFKDGNPNVYESPKCKEKGKIHVYRVVNQEIIPEKENLPYAKEKLSTGAQVYLDSPNLMNELVKETNKFIVGEEGSIKALGLGSCGRLVKNANKTSFNIIPNDESGTGKDYVTKAVLDVFVPKRHFEYSSRISRMALNYMHNAEAEPDWNWDGKILYLSDVSDDVLNSEVLKVFTSDATKSNIVKDGKCIEQTINGKPCIFATTAASTPGKEQLRRFSLMPLDGSSIQTNRIKEFIAGVDNDDNAPEPNSLLMEAMEGLDRVRVIIPYSKFLVNLFPSDTIVRTAFGRFNDYIKASAALHQHQRSRSEKGSVIANTNDYALAKEVFEKMFSAGNIMPLTNNGRSVLNIMKKMDKNTHDPKAPTLVDKHEFWTVNEIEQQAGFSNRGLRNILDSLLESKYIEKGEKEVSKSRTEDISYLSKSMAYRVKNQTKFNLPTKEELDKTLEEFK